MRKKETLILQALLGVLLGLSLVKQEEYNKKLVQDKNAAIMVEYCNAINVTFEDKGDFTKILSKKCNRNSTTDALLKKSKREKILVTKEKND